MDKYEFKRLTIYFDKARFGEEDVRYTKINLANFIWLSYIMTLDNNCDLGNNNSLYLF